jgi:hypothetical protein
MASWSRRISDRVRIAPVIRSNWGLGYPRRPPGVNAGTWICCGGSIWVRLGNMINPVEP